MLNRKSIRNLFPLVGKDIELRFLSISHVNDDYVGWLNDPEVVKYSSQRFRHHDTASCLDYLRSFEETENLLLAIHLGSSGKFIGTMTAYFSVPHELVDMGIMLGDRCSWGKGLGQEAWSLLLSFLLDACEVRKVTGGALDCNKAMLKIMDGSQMLPDGRRSRQELVDGTAEDIVYFAKFRNE